VKLPAASASARVKLDAQQPLEAIRDMASKALDQIERAAGDSFDAMGIQRVPVHEAFYEACFFGNRRQMPPMQEL